MRILDRNIIMQDNTGKRKNYIRKLRNIFLMTLRSLPLQAILALAQNDLKTANHYIEKYKSSLKEKSSSETEILISYGRHLF